MTVKKRGYGWTELKPSIRFKIYLFNFDYKENSSNKWEIYQRWGGHTRGRKPESPEKTTNLRWNTSFQSPWFSLGTPVSSISYGHPMTKLGNNLLKLYLQGQWILVVHPSLLSFSACMNEAGLKLKLSPSTRISNGRLIVISATPTKQISQTIPLHMRHPCSLTSGNTQRKYLSGF